MEKLYTKNEIAQYLRVSVRTVDRLVLDSQLQVYRIGRQIRIPESTVQQILEGFAMTGVELDKTVTGLMGG